MRPRFLRSARPLKPSTSALVNAPLPHSVFSNEYCLPVDDAITTSPYSGLDNSLRIAVVSVENPRFLPITLPEWQVSTNSRPLPCRLDRCALIALNGTPVVS